MRIRFTKLITSAIILVSVLSTCTTIFAQKAIDPKTEIVTLINGDTTSTGARKNTSYTLARGAVYFALGTIQSNYDLTISASGNLSLAAPKIIILTDSKGNSSLPFKPYKSLTLKGLDMSGVNAAGAQIANIIQTGTTNVKIALKGCTIDSVQSRMILVDQNYCSVFVEDCYLHNSAAGSHSGRFIDARETILDSVVMVNNTFYNFMHTLINRFSGGQKYFKFDHNTVYNIARIPLRIDASPEIIVTNNLFIQTGFAGYLKDWDKYIKDIDMGDRDEWSRIEIWPKDSVAAFASYTQKINFKHNNFWLDPAIVALYPDSVRPYMTLDFDFEKKMVGADTLTWLNENVSFTKAPSCKYIEMCKEHWADGSPQTKPGFTDDKRPYSFTYLTSSKSYTSADGGYPLGDLNWWPEKKALWSSTTGIKQTKAQPSRFSLEQNYPNPFNPSTVIKYSISKASNVTLKVYNVLGKEIATLVNANQGAGEYSVSFDAKSLASGIYFYTISAGSYIETKKMILTK
ncbi:MAG: T9SS type A sorting domain-containing protein [Bacteroidota bacterium]|nr:T9SS type A sorting domain-containing protein [Bacteroidota bacterium]MDP4194976.1 T9SS type A sorting domain-containing protein [Bacteroidota bacterium]